MTVEYLRFHFDWLESIDACDGARRDYVATFGENDVLLDPATMAEIIAARLDICFFLDEVLHRYDTQDTRIRREIAWAVTYAALRDLGKLARDAGRYDELGLVDLWKYARLVYKDTAKAIEYNESHRLSSRFYPQSHIDWGQCAAHQVFEALWSLEVAGGPGESGGDAIGEVLAACVEMTVHGRTQLDRSAIHTIPRTAAAFAQMAGTYAERFEAGIDDAHDRNHPPDDDDDDEDWYPDEEEDDTELEVDVERGDPDDEAE